MTPKLIEALTKYGPEVIILGILAWRSPNILKVLGKAWHVEAKSRRTHQLQMRRLTLDLQTKRDKIAQRGKGEK